MQVIGKGLSGTYNVVLKAATATTTSTTANYVSSSSGNTLTVTLAANVTSAGSTVTATLNDVINAINNADGLSGKDFSFLATLEGGVIGTKTAIEESTAISTFTTSKKADVTINGVVTSDAVAAKGILVLRQDAANKAITIINDAINTVSIERSKLGAVQNRLEHTIANLGVSSENLSAAESRIRDVDMAQEMMNFTRNQILQQAGTAMLAQANMAPQAVLKLLG